MEYVDIYDNNGHRIGYVSDDVWCDAYGNIKGYIMGDCVTDSLQYGKILYKIHNDGTITEGTSNYIVCRIDNDAITEKTSNRIIGRLRYSDKSCSDSTDKNNEVNNSFRSGYLTGKENPGCGIIVLIAWVIIAIIISTKLEDFSFIEVFVGFPIVLALIFFVAKIFG